MGRLSPVGVLRGAKRVARAYGTGSCLNVVTVVAIAAILVGCEAEARKDAPTAPQERSQVVARTGPAPVASPTPTKEAPAPAKPKLPRDLCGKQLDAAPKVLPKKAISRAAKSAPEPSESLSIGGGKWTWINFWAAWCAPCKEEIPRLKRWERDLSGSLRVLFISLDDDTRQLEEFLGQQPTDGVKSTYWLKEGKEREDWLQAAGVDSNAALPVHLLVDPKGRIRCFVGGAVEDADFDQVSKLVSR